MSLVLLLQTGDVPYSDRQVHRCRDDQVFRRVELRGPMDSRNADQHGSAVQPGFEDSHNIMVMPAITKITVSFPDHQVQSARQSSRQDGDTSPRLPVPDPDRLVIGSRQDPRTFSVKVGRPDIVQVCTPAKATSEREGVRDW